MKLAIRNLSPNDEAFIFATYLRHCWFDKDNKTTLKRSTWSKMQHKRLEGLFRTNLVLVACLDEDPNTIVGYGFIDGSKPFTYVKLDWRTHNPSIADLIIKELT